MVIVELIDSGVGAGEDVTLSRPQMPGRKYLWSHLSAQLAAANFPQLPTLEKAGANQRAPVMLWRRPNFLSSYNMGGDTMETSENFTDFASVHRR